MKKVILVIICLLLSSCHWLPGNSAPTIEFTRVPPADEGGPDKMDTIEGRVTGASPGQKIVLFAKSGDWWIQPFSFQPFTDIQADSKWQSPTHLGMEYAALLVEADYHPPAQISVLPTIGDKVIAIAMTKGGEPLPPTPSKTLQFSGYEWKIRNTASNPGGTITNFDPANAWTDEKGFLHLKITQIDGQWRCAEVSLTRSLGYGSYRIVVHETSQLEPAAVLSMFTWDDKGSEENHREMNIEITRWGDPANKNMQYVIQPYYIPANLARFDIPAGVLTHSFRWQPGNVLFKTVRGNTNGATVAEHSFTSGIPSSGNEVLHINLFVFGYAKTPLQKETEVIIEKFEYLP